MMSTIFNIPELKINGDLQTACSSLIDFTWQYNPLTEKEVTKIIQSLNLPSEYIGFHVRRGDKEKEHNLIADEEYIKKADRSRIDD